MNNPPASLPVRELGAPRPERGVSRHRGFGAAIVAATLLAGCGSSGNDSDDPPAASDETTAASTASPAEGSDDTSASEVSTTTEPTTGSDDTTDTPVGDATWNGPDPAAALDGRIDLLDDIIGAPFTADGVAATIELPADFVMPAGTTTGVIQTWEVDLRAGDGSVEEHRIVGSDAAGDEAALDAIQAANDEVSAWSRASSQRQDGQDFNDLYTTDDGGRLTVKGFRDTSGGEPSLQVNVEVEADDIPVPEWAAALPAPEGGDLIYVREGVGAADNFFTGPAGNGDLEIRWFFAESQADVLAEFFASGIIAAAGFEAEDTPMSNLDFRQDLSIGTWSGTVGVGERSFGDETGFSLIWVLRRS